jgi:hypothetical protein
MANVFVHFEPIGAVGQKIRISSDLPIYVVPGRSFVDDESCVCLHTNAC